MLFSARVEVSNGAVDGWISRFHIYMHSALEQKKKDFIDFVLFVGMVCCVFDSFSLARFDPHTFIVKGQQEK